MSGIKTSWHLWWSWDTKKVEKWLENMETKGWTPYKVDMFGTRFKFKRSESSRVRYCVDFQQDIEDQYIKLLEDDDWELVWNDNFGWFIWKKAYLNERPSIYTDSTSLIERNNRVIAVLRPLFYMIIGIFALIGIFRNHLPFIDYVFWIYLLIIALYGYIFLQIKKSNEKLKENNDIEA